VATMRGDAMSDLVDRLRAASIWSQRQDEPAPDWDALLAEAADRLAVAERERNDMRLALGIAVALGKRAARVLIGLGSDAKGARGDALALLPDLRAAGWLP